MAWSQQGGQADKRFNNHAQGYLLQYRGHKHAFHTPAAAICGDVKQDFITADVKTCESNIYTTHLISWREKAEGLF